MEESGQLLRKLAVVLRADFVAATQLVRHDDAPAHGRIQDASLRFSMTIEAYGGIW
ncbi:MAG: hypothetical protein OET44_00015 [Gammaproteobacteria bacterium]|nr:hypothetical protein [Gammaproteobacteria bacterium]